MTREGPRSLKRAGRPAGLAQFDTPFAALAQTNRRSLIMESSRCGVADDAGRQQRARPGLRPAGPPSAQGETDLPAGESRRPGLQLSFRGVGHDGRSGRVNLECAAAQARSVPPPSRGVASESIASESNPSALVRPPPICRPDCPPLPATDLRACV